MNLLNRIYSVRRNLIKIGSITEPVIGVYLDNQTQNLFMLTEETLSWMQFNLRSKQLIQRKRTYLDAISMLELPSLIENIITSNQNFFKTMSPEDTNMLSFENFDKDFNKGKIMKGLGTHQCLDFLNLSLTLPLAYGPQ